MDLLFILTTAISTGQPMDIVTIISQSVNVIISLWNKKSLSNAKTLMTSKFKSIEERLFRMERNEITTDKLNEVVSQEIESRIIDINQHIAQQREERKHQSKINDKFFEKLEVLTIGVAKLQESTEFIKDQMRRGRK